MPHVMPLTLGRLGQWLVFGLLFAVLGFHIVRSTAEMLLAPCPAYDTVFERAAALAACPDAER